MAVLLSIGEFSRATHLSVKALRHYDEVGLLAPADVDRATGYRFYSTAQVPAAHVIRRFRDLEMPLEQIRAVLEAEGPGTRDRVILEHLAQMEAQLEQTQSTVASLRELLAGRSASIGAEHRALPAIRAVAIREPVDWDEVEDWLAVAFDELHSVVEAARAQRTGADGALYTSEFFEAHHGDVVAFVPAHGDLHASGRTRPLDLPPGRFAVMVHRGPFSDIDTTYGALGTYVAERAIGAEGPVREHYLMTDAETVDHAEARTEVCWPIST
jgi:DNA-binding transcriptional MerR regulator